MPWSTYLRDGLLNHLFRDATLSKLGTVYVALANADLTADNVTANELTIGAGGYARIAIGTTNSDWSAPATSGTRRMIANTGTLSGGTASGDLNSANPIGFFGVYDASTAGNLIAYGALGTPKTILSGDSITIAPGALQLLQG